MKCLGIICNLYFIFGDWLYNNYFVLNKIVINFSIMGYKVSLSDFGSEKISI